MPRLKLCYESTIYVSHLRMAQLYQCALQQRCELLPASDYARADVVLLHVEPHDYDALYRRHPALAEKYVIAYCVWEASDIPARFQRSIQRVQEVWTCSRYCQQAFARHHPCVQLVPHIVERDTACSEEDLALVKRTIDYDPRLIYFLTIARRWGGRKNVRGLVQAFEREARHMPHARLIVKVRAPARPGPYTDPRIIWVAEDWSDARINALYRLAHVYVSAHWGEGWGLTMSDAMIFGLPVIATGYSGNLEFMNAGNSVLVDFVESPIRVEDRYDQYTGEMAWGYPDEDDLARKIRGMYDALGSNLVAAQVRRATGELGRFDRRTIEALMTERLDAISRSALGC